MKHRKGIELSINFVVMTLFSIVALTLGIVLVSRMFSGAVEVAEQLSARDEAALSDLLAQGEKVAVPFSSKEARRGETVVFGLGILNVGDDAGAVDFCARVAQAAAGADKPKPVKETYSRQLKGGESARIPVGVVVPKGAPDGSYAISVDVCKGPCYSCSDDQMYGSAQLFVRVK